MFFISSISFFKILFILSIIKKFEYWYLSNLKSFVSKISSLFVSIIKTFSLKFFISILKKFQIYSFFKIIFPKILKSITCFSVFIDCKKSYVLFIYFKSIYTGNFNILLSFKIILIRLVGKKLSPLYPLAYIRIYPKDLKPQWHWLYLILLWELVLNCIHIIFKHFSRCKISKSYLIIYCNWWFRN